MSTEFQIKNGIFIYAGLRSSDYGMWIQGGGTYGAPVRKHKTYQVAGRNGSLTIDEGTFEEVEHIYPAFIVKDFSDNIEKFRNDIMVHTGYQRLEDSYHPDEFYRARYMAGLDPAVAPKAAAGQFNIKFQRDPRRFLKTGEEVQDVQTGTGVFNPTNYDARPLIKVTGYGTLTINSDVITIASGYTYVYIDSETMDCYSGTVNVNNKVSFNSNDFPVLHPGDNGVVFGGTITKVEITPRWWRL